MREAVGDAFEIMVDANQCFTVSEAIRRARAFEPFGLAWLEEPLPAEDLGGHVELAAHTAMPIAVGESLYHPAHFREYLERDACSIVQVDCARIGGITPWLKVAHLAETFNVAVCPHFLMELHVSLTAAVPNARVGRVHSAARRHHDVAAGDRRRLRASRRRRPGLGIDWDFAAIDAPRRRARDACPTERRSRHADPRLAHHPPASRTTTSSSPARSSSAARCSLDENVTVAGLVPPGHKVATRAIRAGEPVKRYNQIIGFARRDIAPGEHVHLNNLAMGAFDRDYAFGADAKPTQYVDAAGDVHGHRPRRRPRRDAQLHRHPVDGELLGDRRARHRRPFHARARSRRFPTSTASSR